MARAWSGYVDALTGGAVTNFTSYITGEFIMVPPMGRVPDLLASCLCIIYSALMALGVKNSTAVNSVLTMVNLGVMATVIVLGFYYADPANWVNVRGGFIPFGFSGVLAGKNFHCFSFNDFIYKIMMDVFTFVPLFFLTFN